MSFFLFSIFAAFKRLLYTVYEARVDAHGRVFYIDHLNKTTSWHRPRGGSCCQRRQSEKVRRQQIDRRFQIAFVFYLSTSKNGPIKYCFQDTNA